MEPAFELAETDGEPVLVAIGDWTALTVGPLYAQLKALPETPRRLDVRRLGRIDVTGAYLLDRAFASQTPPLTGDHPAAGRLLGVVRAAQAAAEPPAPRLRGLRLVVERIGSAVVEFAGEAYGTLAFLGLALVTLAKLLVRPNRIRWVSVVSVMETAGLDALPIVSLLSFSIGAVVAFLGARILSDFGASVFTVELVAFSVMREFGVVITAILLAGRTDSSFTAEIGAMKMRQEIDAMRVLGLNPIEALVVPRLIAMLAMTPLLTFAAVIAGLLGGLLVCWWGISISPVQFITRVQENVPQQHFWVGMAKTPFIAVFLALVGCRHGLETGDDVTSLGRRTTASVVQAIFLVILLDALFAIWFLEMDL